MMGNLRINWVDHRRKRTKSKLRVGKRKEVLLDRKEDEIKTKLGVNQTRKGDEERNTPAEGQSEFDISVPVMSPSGSQPFLWRSQHQRSTVEENCANPLGPSIIQQEPSISQTMSVLQLVDVASRQYRCPDCTNCLTYRIWNIVQKSLENSITVPIAWWPLKPPHICGDQSVVAAAIDTMINHDLGTTRQASPTNAENSDIERAEIAEESRSTAVGDSTVPDGPNEPPSRSNGGDIQPKLDFVPLDKYILCCFETGRLRLRGGIRTDYRYRHIKVSTNDSDYAVFQAFRREYCDIAGALRRRLSLRGLAHIHFVKFEIYNGDRIEIVDSPNAIPPKELVMPVHAETASPTETMAYSDTSLERSIGPGRYNFKTTIEERPFSSHRLIDRFHSRKCESNVRQPSPRDVDYIPGRTERVARAKE
ncbi:hypothetical protein FPQ18DRAFT_310130 [Pyronema domesticum]|nr:hypothetical protein FPQ18DRAFT_310130 [Pyronema domesticum]